MSEKSYILLFISLISAFSLFSQNDQAIGTWEDYIPSEKGTYYTQSDQYLYAASDIGLLRFDKTDLSFKTFTRTEGLSDIRISIVEYAEAEDALLIVYENSNIDIIYEDDIININDILRSNSISGDRTINNVFIRGKFAYLSTAFGIVQIDLAAGLITANLETPESATDFTFYEGSYYCLVGGSIYRLEEAQRSNFIFWSSWELQDQAFGLTEDYTNIEVFQNKLCIAGEEVLQILPQKKSIFRLPSGTLKYLAGGINYLIAGVDFSNSLDSVFFFDNQDQILKRSGCPGAVNHALEMEDGRIFYGSLWDEIRYSNGPEGPCTSVKMPGTNVDRYVDLKFKDDKLFAAAQGPNPSPYIYRFTRGGFTEIQADNIIVYSEANYSQFRDRLFDFTSVEYNPEKDIRYAGAFLGGLTLIFPNDSVVIFDKDNSPIEAAIGDPNGERIDALRLDNSGNLWMSNYLTTRPLKVLQNNGEWKSFALAGNNLLRDILIDDLGFKWITTSDNGLIVFDEGDINTSGDERIKIFRPNNSLLPDENISAIAKDLNGNIWVGSAEGVTIFSCGENVFETNCSSRPVVDDDGDGVGDNLLMDVQVNAIAVDGANRKWIGTNAGIVVVSPSGNEQLFTFTRENSPLLSDQIVALAYDGNSGRMYIATNGGLMSYRTFSTAGGGFNSTSAYAFPNPVTPQYDGPIAIKGLAENAIVKITDSHGNIVFETEALGGQAIWDGTQWNGERVASGVYLAWVSGRDTNVRPSDALIKIAVVR